MATQMALRNALILELIFKQLPQQDLLLIQRVCHTWRYLISSNTELQSALFFHPGARKGNERPDTTCENVQWNPLLKVRFPSFFENDEWRKRADEDTIKALGPWKTADWFSGGSKEDLPQRTSRDEERRLAYTRKEASWRRMLPCKPPIKELQVVYAWGGFGREGGALNCLSFSNEKGVRRQNTDALTLVGQFLTAPVAGADTDLDCLRFGLFHDVLYRFWFPKRTIRYQFDWSFRPPRDFEHSQGKIDEIFILLRTAFPGKEIGGPGRVFAYLHGDMRRTMEIERHYFENFTSPPISLTEVRWDEQEKYYGVYCPQPAGRRVSGC